MAHILKEHKQHNEIIRRYDEVILEKASKASIRDLENEFKQYLTCKDFEAFKKLNKADIESTESEVS